MLNWHYTCIRLSRVLHVILKKKTHLLLELLLNCCSVSQSVGLPDFLAMFAVLFRQITPDGR